MFEIYKKVGETPLEAISTFRKTLDFKIDKICCSGRLDPMAHGKLLVLVNEECKNIGTYNAKDKVYTFSFVVGVSTDTTDVLGLVNDVSSTSSVDNIILSFNKKYEQEYHCFSSNPVLGPEGKRPLWYYSKKNIIVDAPKKMVEIYNINIDSKRMIHTSCLKDIIFKNIGLVNDEIKVNFRYDDTVKTWNHYFDNVSCMLQEYVVTAKVSSGTYIRQLVKDIGIIASVPTMVTDLHRIDLIY